MSTVLTFIKNEWLWSLTWGWYQSALGLFFTTVLFVMIRKIKSLPTLLLIVTSYWSAFVVYLLLVIFSCCYLYAINSSLIYVAVDHSPWTALLLGLFFTLLQSCFLHLAHQKYRIKLTNVISITVVGNGTAAVCASYFTCVAFYS